MVDKKVTYTYDSLERLKTVTGANQVATYNYDNAGRLISRKLARLQLMDTTMQTG